MPTKAKRKPAERKSPLKELLAEHGVSLNELAKRSGLSRSNLAKLAKSGHRVRWMTARRIAAALNLPPMIVFTELLAEEPTDGK